ncbi:formyltetrahydrofolate-dependent phosphoribosylglycinamide formyltransferase [Flavobacteriaceae bacterium MAR_2010_188]|nr:formyltetrahydrofolate-dependent phosphoribosylglycinamide formyltransferase [Flavobacteriaceae bacterium MAR_2010_188]
MKRVVIFASGSGSNAENIIKFFSNSKTASVVLVLTNNPHAKVLERCKVLGTSAISFNSTSFYKTDHIKLLLESLKPDLIVLAGFLWKFPSNLLEAFPDKVINVHPALLPNYGGKGMYGKHVHEAIINNKEQESGITIHYVNANYDEGNIIFQAKCTIDEMDTADNLAYKIHGLEMEHFPKVIEKLLETESNQ